MEKHGIAVLVDNSLHAVFEVPEELTTAGSLDRIILGLLDIPGIRVRRCIIDPAQSTEEIVEAIRRSLL